MLSSHPVEEVEGNENHGARLEHMKGTLATKMTSFFFFLCLLFSPIIREKLMPAFDLTSTSYYAFHNLFGRSCSDSGWSHGGIDDPVS